MPSDIRRAALEKQLCTLASRQKIAAVLSQYHLSQDPLAAKNSLSEHFWFLLRCGVPANVVLQRLASPEWLRYSLELRKGKKAPQAIGLALTEEGRLYARGSLSVFAGVMPWLLNLFRRPRKPPHL